MKWQEEESELISRPGIGKRYCLSGILRAENDQNKRRRPPYHGVAAMILMTAFIFALPCSAQVIEHEEGILIDTSGSVSRRGKNNELFREYLLATRKLLQTEPPSTLVWVSSISTDSFGEAPEILKGWTPESHGVFTDDLNHARRQLVTSFEQKSADITPVASGTDIFGALWRMKALFEPTQKANSSRTVSRTIWIFSDMMNETAAFSMPNLLEAGPELMLREAKTTGLLVPLAGYKVHVYGASTEGLTPQAWTAIKKFWTMYFSSAGAELLTYSGECDLPR